MITGQMLLQHQNFTDAYASVFQDLRNSQELVDVTLACDDETIEAHKVVISACSPFFRHILSRITNAQPFIFLKGVHHKDLKSLIDFIYLGETRVAAEDLKRFFKTARELKIAGLVEDDIFRDPIETKKVDISFPIKNTKTNIEETLEQDELTLWKCIECNYTFSDETDLKFHLEMNHTKNTVKEEKEYVSRSKRKSTHTARDNSFQMINYDVWRIETSKRMQEFKDPLKGKLWRCIECGTIKTKFKIECHIETHIKELGLFSYACRECGKTTKTRKPMLLHVDQHKKIKS